jgi:hypothetical protein
MRVRPSKITRSVPSSSVAALVAVLAVATLGLGGMALAAGSSRSSRTVPSGQSRSVTARCKPGRTAVSGGFAAPGFTPNSTGSTVARFTAKRVGKRGFRASAANFGSQDGQLVALAYCAKPSHAIRVRSKRVQVPPLSYRSTTAKCRRGSEAIAGGFAANSFSPNSGVITVTSRRKGKRGWKVGGFNVAGPPTGASSPLTAYAYCERSGPKLHTRLKRVNAPAGSVRSVRVKCPKRSTALSGGFDGNFGGFGQSLTTSVAVSSRRGGHGKAWRADALSAGPVGSTVTTYAYCVRRKPQ